MYQYRLFLFITIITLLTSCNNPGNVAITSNPNLVRTDNFELQFPADYWFHTFSRKKTLNYNSAFKSSLKKNKGQRIFTAHTTIENHCSVVGLYYENITTDSLIQKIRSELQENDCAFNLKTEELKIGEKEYLRFRYELRDPERRVDHNFIEYYTKSGKGVFRIAFWTLENRIVWIKKESEQILETYKSLS